MNAIPLTVAELKALISGVTTHTRAVTDTELLAAANFGYRKVLRAIRAVRPAPFLSYRDGFALAAGVSEYDVGEFFPDFFRPVRLAFGTDGRQTASFVYRGLQHEDSVEAEVRGGSAATFFYDVLEGFLPAASSLIAVSTGSTSTMVVASVAGMAVGNPIRVAGHGPLQSTTTGNITLDYVGRAVIVDAAIGVKVVPALTFAPPVGVLVEAFRRKVLRIVPAPASGLTGRLWYQYTQDRLRKDEQLLEPMVAEHSDCVVAYALSRLKLAIGDSDADRWLRDADAMRAELVQDLEPGSYENTEPFGSALHGVIGY